MALAIIFDSIGVGEWLILLAVVLVVVGPKRLPATARSIGKHYAKLRRAADGFKRQLMEMDNEITRAAEAAEREAESAVRDVESAVDDITGDVGGPGEDFSEADDVSAGYDGYDGYDDGPDGPFAGAAAPESAPAPETPPAAEPAPAESAPAAAPAESAAAEAPKEPR